MPYLDFNGMMSIHMVCSFVARYNVQWLLRVLQGKNLLFQLGQFHPQPCSLNLEGLDSFIVAFFEPIPVTIGLVELELEKRRALLKVSTGSRKIRNVDRVVIWVRFAFGDGQGFACSLHYSAHHFFLPL